MRWRARVAAAIVGLVVVLAAATAATAAPDAGAEGDFVSRVKGARAAKGIGGLAVDGELTGIARRWSQQMADSQRLSHNPNLSKEVTQDWEKLAENVGFGGDVASIHEAFMNSSAHRANILDPAMTRIGVGVVVDGSGQLWVTEVFMRLRSDSGAASPPPTTAAPKVTAPPATAPPTTRAPRPAPTAPPVTEVPPTTEAPPTTVPEPPPPPPPPPVPSTRLVLVLDGLVALDRGR